MKRLIFFIFAATLAMQAPAQQQGQGRPPAHEKFSPEKFKQELKEYITKTARLTPQEAAKFFPLYEELQNKKRALFQKNKIKHRPKDEQSCKAAIRERDENEVKAKKLEQQYHEKFMRVISAQKLFEVIRAENEFHKGMFKGFVKKGNQRPRKSK